MVDSVDATNLREHVEQLCWADGYQSRIGFTPGNYLSAEYIAKYFESLPGINSVIRDTFKLASATYPYNGYPIINIVAQYEGSEPDSPLVVLGAHYDASGSHEANWDSDWQNIRAQGADDNATGVAAIMEIARILSNPENSFNNTNSIKFIAFGAEEYHPAHPDFHHLGSLYDADYSSRNGINLKGVVVMDMFGYNQIMDYVEIISDTHSNWLVSEAHNSVTDYVSGLSVNSYPVDVPYSDHDSYQQYGYSSILFMENDRPWNDDLPYYQKNPYYHSQGDSIGTLNFSLISKVTKASLATIAELSSETSTSINSVSVYPLAQNLAAEIFPNPANPIANIRINILTEQNISISIFNSLGQKVASLCEDKFINKGTHLFSWKTDQVSSGLYFVSIRNSVQQHQYKLIVIK